MLTKLIRIGRDAEVKYLPSGTAVMTFPAVYDIGYGDKKRPQWIECVLFGDRCAKVAPYLTKPKQLVIYAEDVGIDEWDKTDGSGKGFKLRCKLVSFDFVSEGKREEAPQGAVQAAPQQGLYPDQPQAKPLAQQQAERALLNAPQPAPVPQPQQVPVPESVPLGQALAPQPAAPAQGMDSFDDDIPF